jgi:2-C-methyl-D-erythritol 4-phosphate cytidylyltransferase
MGNSGLSLAIVVAAAGYGTRLDSGLPKQYVPILGIPMIQRTLSALNACSKVDSLLVVVNWEDVEYCRSEIRLEHLDDKILKVVPGGEKRPVSVRNGLTALAEMGEWDLVGVHDGARPLVTCAEIERAVAALEADESLDGVVPGIPSVDTVKIVDESGVVVSTPERRLLWRAQTPQIFRWKALMDAYRSVGDDEMAGLTDDASLVEARGGRVMIVQGAAENFKITDRLDLQHAEQVLAERRV